MVPKLKQNLVFFFLILAILVTFGLGTWYGKSQVICKVCPPEEVDFSLFWEAWDTLKEKFVDKGKFDVQEMIYGAISGMVESLDDPYTIFLNPEDTKRFIEDVSGTFEGVGMEIGIREGYCRKFKRGTQTTNKKASLRWLKRSSSSKGRLLTITFTSIGRAQTVSFYIVSPHGCCGR